MLRIRELMFKEKYVSGHGLAIVKLGIHPYCECRRDKGQDDHDFYNMIMDFVSDAKDDNILRLPVFINLTEI